MKHLKILWRTVSIVLLTIFAATTIVMAIVVPLLITSILQNDAKGFVCASIVSVTIALFFVIFHPSKRSSS